MDSGITTTKVNGYANVASRLNADHLRLIRTFSELNDGPIPTVLDTSCVRTGLHYQLTNDRLPASIEIARSGRTRLFIELDTLNETWEKLPLFAEQLKTPLANLQRILADDWLPLLSVVSIPENLRHIDARSTAVQDLDADDYATAALASLLSPCILLTRNHTDFLPLNINESTQGVDAIVAVYAIKTGESEVQAVLMIPAVSTIAIGKTIKWAEQKMGPKVWAVLALLAAGGVHLYRQQPQDRKTRIKHGVSEVGRVLVEEYARASSAVHHARNQLSASVVPIPEVRSVLSAVTRKLALAEESMSAQQLCDGLDDSVRPAVEPLRRFLHANKTTMFREVRRGGFVLGDVHGLAHHIGD